MFRTALLLWFLLAGCGEAAVSTTTTLAVTPVRSTLSQPVTLTASVSPPTAAGKVTFYDGTGIVGVSNLAGGKATLTAKFLPSGPRSLRARYWGNVDFEASASNVAQVTVIALEGHSFPPARGSPFKVGRGPNRPAVGDFNTDGNLDIAILSNDLVTVLLSDGNGGFAQAPGSPFPAGDSRAAVAVAVGDFNGDGNPDLVIVDFSSGVTVLLGDGSGRFARAQGSPFPAGDAPIEVVVGDFNGDGKPDLIVVDLYNNTVTVFLGDGIGGFAVNDRPFAAGDSPFSVAVGDFNGDGKPDLAVASTTSNFVTVLLGDGDGGFLPVKDRPVVAGTSGYVVVGDFNGDDKPDLAVAGSSNSVTILLGDGNGGFMPTKDGPVKVGIGPTTAALGDFNGDGALDLAVANAHSGDVTILLGHGDGGFSPAVRSPIPVGKFPFLAVGDFNGDGLLDIATANGSDDDLSVLLANGRLTITLSKAGLFQVSQNGLYTLTVSNPATTPVSGQVTVTDSLPSGLTARSAMGDGWVCSINGQVVTCNRRDELAAGAQYPDISLTVLVAAGACPSVTNNAELMQRVPIIASQLTPISGCLTITQEASRLVVNTMGSISLTVNAAGGAAIGALVTVRDVLPAGLTPQKELIAEGWGCSVEGQVVLCSRSDGLAAGAQYPPISLTVDVAASACPSVINPVEITLAGAQPDVPAPGAVDLFGCLVIAPQSLTFETSLSKTTDFLSIFVKSNDRHPLQLSLAPIDSTAFRASLGPVGCSTLNFGETCGLGIDFLNFCPGVQSAKLRISTDSGATYTVPIQGVGLPGAVSLKLEDGTVLSDNVQVKPNEQHTVNLTLIPALNAQCAQKPTLAMSFSPLDPDGKTYDVTFDPATSVLRTGTVAGKITLKAQVAGKDIEPVNGAGSVTLQAPSQTGVIQKVSIGNRTASTFEVAISGFSTPRETGPSATTQVCFAFSAAKGASVDVSTQFCALKQDIEIWYERPVSYPFGSQFSGSVIVSFSGDGKAIGGVKAWVKNKEGDSAPYCLDFQSGNQQDCPK